MVTKRGCMVTYIEELQTIKSNNALIAWFARSHDKVKLLYLHYHSAHGYPVWKDGDLPWGAPNHEVIQRFDHVVLQGHVTKKNHYISPTRVPMATKLDSMIT